MRRGRCNSKLTREYPIPRLRDARPRQQVPPRRQRDVVEAIEQLLA
jgi:hypothetical protein